MKPDNLPPCSGGRTTGMAYSLLSEIADGLRKLAGDGRTSSIDLRSIPLTEADIEQLEEMLGRGEISAELDLAGKSEVWETRYPGVWWIRHRGGGDRIATETIEITRIPEILKTHPADIEAAAERIRQDLAQVTDSAHRSEHELEASHVR